MTKTGPSHHLQAIEQLFLKVILMKQGWVANGAAPKLKVTTELVKTLPLIEDLKREAILM